MKFVFLLLGVSVAYMAGEDRIRVRRQTAPSTVISQTATVSTTTQSSTTNSTPTTSKAPPPITTKAPTTVVTTIPTTATVVTTIPTTTTTANPDEYSVQARASDGNCTCNVRGPNITEESICYIERDFQGLLDLEARVLSIVAKAEGLTASTLGNEMVKLEALLEHLELNYLSQSMNTNYKNLQTIQTILAEITLAVKSLVVNKTTEALVNQMTSDMWTASAEVDERLEVNSVYVRKDLVRQVADLETKAAGCAIGGESIEEVTASYFPADSRPLGDIDTSFCERNTFTGVGWPMTHTSESGVGFWMKDPQPDSEENRTAIYYLAGHSGAMYMYKWNTYWAMWSRASKVTLGRTAKHLYGTNHALFNGSLYYYSSEKTIERVDYRDWLAKASLSIPEVETTPNFNRGGYTFVNLAVDEYGLYVAYVQQDWSWVDFPNTCINVETLTSTSASTLEECKKKCETEEGFRCMSLDWNSYYKDCYLKLYDSGDKPLTSPCYRSYTWYPWHHSERKFADTKRSSYIQIKQLNPIDLTEIRHWGTHVAKSSISNLYFVCGVMYTMDSWNTPTPGRSQYAFDTRANDGRGASFTTKITIPAMYKDMIQIGYEMSNRMLFAFDASHLMTYSLRFEPKATPSTTTQAP